jgi:hypothetical protein
MASSRQASGWGGNDGPVLTGQHLDLAENLAPFSMHEDVKDLPRLVHLRLRWMCAHPSIPFAPDFAPNA